MREIEACRRPCTSGMTIRTSLTREQSSMKCRVSVAAGTGLRGAFEDIIDMTGLTCHTGMCASQFEAR